MTTEHLERLAEQVKNYFLSQIMELSNGETEVVVEYLLQYFEESLERLRQGTR